MPLQDATATVWAVQPYRQADRRRSFSAMPTGEGDTRGQSQPVAPGRPGLVLLRDFIDLPRSLELVSAGINNDDRWLVPLAREAEEDGEALLSRIGPGVGSGRLSREVGIALGGWRARGEGIAVSVRWGAVEAGRLFPVFDGDLELAPLGPGSCRLVLMGSYTPPFGTLGWALDRALLHRVAESTARAFLVKLAQHLERNTS